MLFGIAYGFKVTAHLGVDAVTNMLRARAARGSLALIAGAACIVYALLLLKGAWDYWAPFANLPPTTGRWFPTGFDWDARRTGPSIETDQIPMPRLAAAGSRRLRSTTGERLRQDCRASIPYVDPADRGRADAVPRLSRPIWRIWTRRRRPA